MSHIATWDQSWHGLAQARFGSAIGGDSIRKVAWLPAAMQFLWSNTEADLNVGIGSIVGAFWMHPKSIYGWVN